MTPSWYLRLFQAVLTAFDLNEKLRISAGIPHAVLRKECSCPPNPQGSVYINRPERLAEFTVPDKPSYLANRVSLSCDQKDLQKPRIIDDLDSSGSLAITRRSWT